MSVLDCIDRYTHHPERSLTHDVLRRKGMATSHRPSSRVIPTHMESAVTKLLVATRQLLESLQMWSAMKMTDLEVSRLRTCVRSVGS